MHPPSPEGLTARQLGPVAEIGLQQGFKAKVHGSRTFCAGQMCMQLMHRAYHCESNFGLAGVLSSALHDFKFQMTRTHERTSR